MELEKEIHQKAFKSEHQKLIVNVLFTGKWLEYRQSAAFKSYGLTAQQFNVLRILRGCMPKPATVQYLVERMLDKSSNASRIVDKLIEKDLVERSICESNRRMVDITITKKALDLLALIDANQEMWNNYDRVLDNEEARTLNALLDKLRDAQ
jgi:DNA-binding MarR family transcriptional regulator